MDDDYYFDRWLKERRGKRGLTQDALAKLARTPELPKISKQTVSSIERQAPHPNSGAPYRPSVEQVDAFAVALKESVGEARLAAGYAPPREEVTDEQLEKDKLVALYFRRRKLKPKNKARVDQLLEMVDREIDRLEQEEGAS